MVAQRQSQMFGTFTDRASSCSSSSSSLSLPQPLLPPPPPPVTDERRNATTTLKSFTWSHSRRLKIFVFHSYAISQYIQLNNGWKHIYLFEYITFNACHLNMKSIQFEIGIWYLFLFSLFFFLFFLLFDGKMIDRFGKCIKSALAAFESSLY